MVNQIRATIVEHVKKGGNVHLVGGNLIMCVSSEDIALLAQLVAEEHGSKAEQHINQYIDDLRQTNDKPSLDLWQKVAAFWYAKNRHPLG